MTVATAISIELLPQAVLVLDEAYRILDVNQRAATLFDSKKLQLIGQNVGDLIELDLDKRSVNANSTLNANLKFGVNNSKSCLVKWTKDADQQVLFIEQASVSGDITNQVAKYSTENVGSTGLANDLSPFARQVLTCINEPYWEWNVASEKVHISAQLMALLGYEAKAVTAPFSIWKKHISRENWRKLKPKISRHLAGETEAIEVDFEIKSTDSELIDVRLQGRVLEFREGKPVRMYGSISNITDAQNLLAQLKTQNKYLNLAEKLGNSGHWRYDIHAKSLYCSPEVYRIFGVREANFKFTLDAVLSFVGEEEKASILLALSGAVQQGHSFYYKTQITQRNGRIVKIEVIAKVEFDIDGKPKAFFGVFRDVTKAEETHEKLNLMAMVNHAIKVPIFFINEQDSVVYQDLTSNVEGRSSALFNYINFSITEYLSLKQEAKVEGQVKKANVSFDKFTTIFDLSITYEPQEGIYIWIVENVTDKFKAEQQQLISNRMAILGNTFGSVSHDINNVLGVALGSIEMLELKFKQGSQDISTYIDRVKNAIDKGKTVTERLLAFTRKPTVKVVEFDPIRDIKDNKYLFEQLLVTSISLQFDLGNVKCMIRFPQGEFINILLNLVLNAQDAIQEEGASGTIVISANINEDNKFEVHVKDSGIGIKEENLAKVFDPFYSSKSVNKGNGIGLANVYSTMYKHNGEVQVEGESDLGGAHFTLVFKTEYCDRRKHERAVNKANTSIIGKRILILDDEESIAEFVAAYLQSEGAQCVAVNTKKQLLAQLDNDASFDIFITDMILPDLTGREAVQIVQSYVDTIQIYSMSGYIAQEHRKWTYPVLRKPFNSAELASFLAC